jgi:hypothetical protein
MTIEKPVALIAWSLESLGDVHQEQQYSQCNTKVSFERLKQHFEDAVKHPSKNAPSVIPQEENRSDDYEQDCEYIHFQSSIWLLPLNRTRLKSN